MKTILVVLFLTTAVMIGGSYFGQPEVAVWAGGIGCSIIGLIVFLKALEEEPNPIGAVGGLFIAALFMFGGFTAGHRLAYGENHFGCLINRMGLNSQAGQEHYTFLHPTLGVVLERGSTDSKELYHLPQYFVVKFEKSDEIVFYEMSDPADWYAPPGATIMISPRFPLPSAWSPTPANAFRITTPS